MLPAVVGGDQTERVRHRVKVFEELRGDAAEALVHGNPGHDAGVALVALQHLRPLPLQPVLGRGRVLVEVGHLTPDQEAQPVGPVQPARILDLLVLAGAVEAHGLGQLNVAPQVSVAGRCEAAGGPVALVQHQPLDIRLVETAETEIALHLVLAQAHRDVVEDGPLRAPGLDRLQRHRSSPRLAAPRSHPPALQPDLQVGGARALYVEAERARRQVGLQAQRLDRAGGQRLQPYRLPDAGRGRVEDAFRPLLPVLLAARDGEVGGRIFGAHHEHVAALPHGPRDVDAEGRVPALVRHQLRVIHPDGGPVVDRAEVQHETLCGRCVKAAPVPDHVVRPAIHEARQLPLGREGDVDAVGEAPGIGAERELPLAVQVDPVAPPELRPRIFGPGGHSAARTASVSAAGVVPSSSASSRRQRS